MEDNDFFGSWVEMAYKSADFSLVRASFFAPINTKLEDANHVLNSKL